MMALNNRAARLLLALSATVTLAGLAACGPSTTTANGGGGSSTPSMAPSMAPSMSMPDTSSAPAPAPAPAAAPVASSSVSIKGFAFSPAAITVKVGTTVTWTNLDQDAHTVTAKDSSFGSQALDTGASYKFTFTKPGTYDYLCTIHPFMTATVVVTP
ncbi:MAG TPA: cupredoxin family copper-binding protein [Pseudonocardiaceae bacterium]|nr:cupredoxin family copper-binding protein [Pseudonocardiaceae bacterium]